jgi:ArsR family transcriptional regulator
LRTQPPFEFAEFAFLSGDRLNSAVSHQLRQLCQTRLVKNRKDGKVVFYSLDDEHVGNVFAQGLLHVREG